MPASLSRVACRPEARSAALPTLGRRREHLPKELGGPAPRPRDGAVGLGRSWRPLGDEQPLVKQPVQLAAGHPLRKAHELTGGNQSALVGARPATEDLEEVV